MNKSSLVAEHAVGANKCISSNSRPVGLHTQNVGDNLLRILVQLRMEQCHMVIACDDISEGGKSLLDSLDFDRVREHVPEALQLHIGAGHGHEEALAISCRHPANRLRVAHGGVNHWHVHSQLLLEYRVEVFRAARRHQAVCVRQRREAPHFIRVLEICSVCHFLY